MSEQCVVAVFDDVETARKGIYVLERGEFPKDKVSLVCRGSTQQPDVVENLAMKDDSVRDAAVGAGLGAVVGMLAGLAGMFVAGVGAVFLAGPVGGFLFGAVTGGFLGGLAGWGVHSEQIRKYEQLVKEGKVLLIAHGNPVELLQADRILREMEPEEIHLYAKTGAESPEVNS